MSAIFWMYVVKMTTLKGLEFVIWQYMSYYVWTKLH